MAWIHVFPEAYIPKPSMLNDFPRCILINANTSAIFLTNCKELNNFICELRLNSTNLLLNLTFNNNLFTNSRNIRQVINDKKNFDEKNLILTEISNYKESLIKNNNSSNVLKNFQLTTPLINLNILNNKFNKNKLNLSNNNNKSHLVPNSNLLFKNLTTKQLNYKINNKTIKMNKVSIIDYKALKKLFYFIIKKNEIYENNNKKTNETIHFFDKKIVEFNFIKIDSNSIKSEFNDLINTNQTIKQIIILNQLHFDESINLIFLLIFIILILLSLICFIFLTIKRCSCKSLSNKV